MKTHSDHITNHIDPSTVAALILDALAGRVCDVSWSFVRGFWSVVVVERVEVGEYPETIYACKDQATAEKVVTAMGQMFEVRAFIDSTKAHKA